MIGAKKNCSAGCRAHYVDFSAWSRLICRLGSFGREHSAAKEKHKKEKDKDKEKEKEKEKEKDKHKDKDKSGKDKLPCESQLRTSFSWDSSLGMFRL
jgi:hypothetical protein